MGGTENIIIEAFEIDSKVKTIFVSYSTGLLSLCYYGKQLTRSKDVDGIVVDPAALVGVPDDDVIVC